MNFCPYCGASVAADYRFCAQCGKPLIAPEAPPVDPPHRAEAPAPAHQEERHIATRRPMLRQPIVQEIPKPEPTPAEPSAEFTQNFPYESQKKADEPAPVEAAQKAAYDVVQAEETPVEAPAFQNSHYDVMPKSEPPVDTTPSKKMTLAAQMRLSSTDATRDVPTPKAITDSLAARMGISVVAPAQAAQPTPQPSSPAPDSIATRMGILPTSTEPQPPTTPIAAPQASAPGTSAKPTENALSVPRATRRAASHTPVMQEAEPTPTPEMPALHPEEPPKKMSMKSQLEVPAKDLSEVLPKKEASSAVSPSGRPMVVRNFSRSTTERSEEPAPVPPQMPPQQFQQPVPEPMQPPMSEEMPEPPAGGLNLGLRRAALQSPHTPRPRPQTPPAMPMQQNFVPVEANAEKKGKADFRERFFSFQGRLARKPFAFGSIYPLLVVCLLYNFSDSAIEALQAVTNGAELFAMAKPLGILLAFLAAVVFFIVSTCSLTIRRWHDLGKPGTFAIATFLPYVGPLALLYLLIKPGNVGENDFGADPLELPRQPL